MKFTSITTTAVPIPVDNIDTDTLIPKQYLKSTEKTGFADALFDPWRYDLDMNPIPDFPLNQKEYEGAQILLAGENFGCGSSREHAAWALQDYGFRVVIAGSYSPIFYMNWLNNGNLPIKLEKSEREALVALDPQTPITVDLEKQTVTADGRTFSFAIEETWKQRLLEGTDAISRTLKFEPEIRAYEDSRPAYWRE